MNQSAVCDCQAGMPTVSTLSTAPYCYDGREVHIFMYLLEGLISQQCDVADVCGRATPRFRNVPDDEYDFIVVGGGTSGSVLASRLSEVANWKVLLIEAGTDEPVATQVPSLFKSHIGTDIDWKFYTEPEKYACLSEESERCSWPKAKVLGGSSVFSSMIYMRGNAQDYDNWAAAGNPGWNYKDVLPYFLKSEDNLEIDEMGTQYHAKGGLLPVTRLNHHPKISYDLLKAAEEMGFKVQDLNGRNSTGAMIAQTTSKNGSRYSTARAFLRPARFRENLHILLNTTVTKILISNGSKVAYGVEIMQPKHSCRVIEIRARKEVILTAGAMNSPKLLMLSGVGPKARLEKVGVPVVHVLPGVGKNLQNHVSFSVSFFTDGLDANPLDWMVALKYFMHRKGLMSSIGLSDVVINYASKYADHPDVPDTQVRFGGLLASCSADGKVLELLSNELVNIQMTIVALQPISRGYITLDSDDPMADPLIVANHLKKKRDLLVLLEGVVFASKISALDVLQNHEFRVNYTFVKDCEQFKVTSFKYWKCVIKHKTESESNQAGTCKMGPSTDKKAVVDHELKVHGIQRLRVMDTSIMPNVTSGDTTAPAIMIAEKGADMIKRAWLYRGLPRTNNNNVN